MTARGLVRAVAMAALAPIWRRSRPRIERLAQTVVDAESRQRALEIQTVTDDVRAVRTHVEQLLGAARARQDDIDDKLRLMAAQLAAGDARIADLERPPTDLHVDDAERAEARRLIDEIRVEHARARNGLATAAYYEERIARLERRSTDR